jgi:hypothetical protein
VRTGITFAVDVSILERVRTEPEAERMYCSLLPANKPIIACVIAVGEARLSEYINMVEVDAILAVANGAPGTVWLLRALSRKRARKERWKPAASRKATQTP